MSNTKIVLCVYFFYIQDVWDWEKRLVIETLLRLKGHNSTVRPNIFARRCTLSETRKEIQGVQVKLCFLHDSMQPLPRLHCCKRSSKLSTQCECTVTPIGWQFFVEPIAAEFWRGRGGKLSKILGKMHNSKWTPCIRTIQRKTDF